MSTVIILFPSGTTPETDLIIAADGEISLITHYPDLSCSSIIIGSSCLNIVTGEFGGVIVYISVQP